MLKLIKVEENTITRYKQEDNFVSAGLYYHYTGRPSTKEKKIYSLIACGGNGFRFMWLAPYESWVKRMKDGVLLSKPSFTEEPDWDMIGISPLKLRDWQKKIVKEAWNYLRCGMRYGKGWIAKLGAGKTLAGLLLCQMFEKDEAAVLVDRYLFSTWKDQAEEWGLECPLISTYESCHKLPSTIKCLIVDEVLKLKSPNAQRSIRVSNISENCEVAIGFTGIATSGKGSLDFRWLRSIIPGCVPSEENAWKFKFGLDTELKDVGVNKAYITTEWDKEAVAEYVAPFIHTVDPEEIDAELPELTEIFLECKKPQEYDLVKAGGATASTVHKKLAQLRQITDGFIYDDAKLPVRVNNAKLKLVREFVDNLGEPVVLVSNWSEGIAILKEEFEEFEPSVVQGGTKDPNYEIKAFQNGETDMLIANAGFSKGMNLQHVCRVIIFLSVSSKPDDYQQMVGRVYRPGQKHAVQIVHIVCKDTLDRHIIGLVKDHKDMSEDYIEQLLLEELAEEGGF